MANGIETLPQDQGVPVNGIASFTPSDSSTQSQYVYGMGRDELDTGPYLSRLLTNFYPFRREVLEEPEYRYENVGWPADRPLPSDYPRANGELPTTYRRTITPGVYGEPEWDVSHMPIVRGATMGIEALMDDPTLIQEWIAKLPDYAKAAASSLRSSAEAYGQGFEGGYDPTTGKEYRSEDILMMLPGVGIPSAMALAPRGSIGVMGGGGMRVYDKKIGDLNRLEAEFKGRDRSDNLVKQEIWDRQSGEKFKIYRSSADGKPRIEIDTTNVNIKPSAFNFSSRIQQKPDGTKQPVESVLSIKATRTGQEKTLKDVLDFPELYKQYDRPMPSQVPGQSGTFQPISNIKIRNGTAQEMRGNIGAYYDVRTDSIVVGRTASPEQMTSSILHEIQHAIQAREGWYNGAAGRRLISDQKQLDIFRSEANEAMRELMNPIFKAFGRKKFSNISEEDLLYHIRTGLQAGLDGDIRGKNTVNAILGNERAFNRILGDKNYRDDFRELLRIQQSLNEKVQRNQEFRKFYWREPGEVEARNVEGRRFGSDRVAGEPRGTYQPPEELRRRHPELSAEHYPEEFVYDIGTGDLGVR